MVGVSILIPAIVLSPLGMWLFVFIVSLMSLWEFIRGMQVQQKRYVWVALACVAGFWGLEFFNILMAGKQEIPPSLYALVLILALPILEIVALFNKEENRPVETLGTIVLGYIYVVFPFYLFLDMSMPGPPSTYDFKIPLGTLFITWTLDVMSYFFGRFFGKNQLFPRISPKKTWEGSIGGVAFCLGMGVLMDIFLPTTYSWVVIAILTSLFSQMGDLVESMFKRSVNLKDSGKILPGHGGMLDRFDGMLLSIPFIYLYFLTLGN